MALAAGMRLGPYEIVAPLGAGGMGEVYRALDTKLQRIVAIKVLPDAMASDRDRLARFEREAQSLAALNHPNIAAVYAVEDRAPLDDARGAVSGSRTAIVMEFVEGEDLSARIARGPIPITEALELGRQIADGLAAAHEAGIIHRDLKPANIKLRTDGTVKLLDFGLAKALAPDGPNAAADNMNSPTLTARATQMGVVLGTAAYMAPEQARARPVDKRADGWAFGVVLFEMIAGARPFSGDDVTDVLAAVVRAEPDWKLLPAAAPPLVRRLLGRCLTKDVKQRLHDIADARLDIDETLHGAGTAASAAPVDPSRNRNHLLWATGGALVAGLLAVAAFAMYARRAEPTPAGVTRTLVSITPAEVLEVGTKNEGRPARNAFALSPDGRTLVFTALQGSRRQLYLRPLDRLEATPIAGTDDAEGPFFSPDEQWIGFWANGALRKILLAGGAPTVICETQAVFGASWSVDNTIVFAHQSGPLLAVAAGGGTPKAVTRLDPKSGEYSHRLPHFLPDGKSLVFTTVNHFLPDWRDARLWLLSLASGERWNLGQGADAWPASSGHLVFVRFGTLVAARFDPASRRLGDALTIVDDVMQAANTADASTETGAGQFDLSTTGTLVYVTGGTIPDPVRTILTVDRHGTAVPLTMPPPARPFLGPRLSTDQSHLVVWSQGVDRTVWTYARSLGTLSRLTSVGRNSRAIWTQDGKRITYSGSSNGADNLFWIPADGSGEAERLTTSDQLQMPSAWSLDGRTLAFIEIEESAQPRIMTLSIYGDRQPKLFLHTRFNETYPEFSPDGHYMAYTSNELGRDDVYVQPYPGPGPRTMISNGGGRAPVWSASGRELFYAAPTAQGIRMMSAAVTLSPSFTIRPAQPLFEGPYSTQSITRGYDVTSDGQQFFFAQTIPRPPVRVTQMVLVQNWLEDVKKRLK